MSIDIAAAIFILVLAGLGYFSGAVKQCARLVGAALGVFAAPTVAAIASDVLNTRLDGGLPPTPMTSWLLLVGSAATIYLTVALLAALIVKLMKKSSDELTRADRLAGALIGAGKAAAIVYFLASSLVLIEGHIEKHDPHDNLRVQSSHTLGAARAYPDAWNWALGQARELPAEQAPGQPPDLRTRGRTL